MAIEFQNATTAVVAGADNGNITINVPAGVSDGDFLVTGFAYEQATSPADPFMSVAWNQITEIDGITSGFDHDLFVLAWWRRASSEPASYAITTNGTYGDSSAAFMLRYTGVVSSGDPVRNSAVAFASGAASSSASGPGLSGLESTDLSLQLCGINHINWDEAGNITLAGPGGSWVERANQANDTSDSKTGIAVIDQFNQATGPSWTSTSTLSNVGFGTIGFALIEEPAEATLKSLIVNQQAIRRAHYW
jgi:hypothetical protein